MTFHIDPILKADIQRRASLNGNSASSEGEAMLEAKAREDLHKQQAENLATTMERMHAKANRRMAKKLSFFLTAILFDVGETKVLTTNLLGMQKGMTEDMLKDILTDADKHTKRRLSRKYPELTEFTQAIEQWLLGDEEEEEESGGGTNGARGRGGRPV
jgi:predicted kinase